MDIQLVMNRLLVVKRDQIVYIELSEILYIERINQKTLIHTDLQEIRVGVSLKQMMSMLPDIFVRSHKSYIVNILNLRELNFFNRNTYEAYYKNRKTALVCKDIMRNSIKSLSIEGGERI
ncbi:LytTR family DNA-binding domain-containing protein [Paenibacillus alba]|uniref:LytTR family DNA-binding domain-containing protein n=1 Tax=Paenibacillus alba TaxID=1197127 RepID=A0ABU6G400_9BACL|nr:LytTR family DNA-binding domain-containing protein [Paenibacillus alba]MEC0228866.1 LytTR family DNA-binding domain-containing protein [Paenibacillus alba]